MAVAARTTRIAAVSRDGAPLAGALVALCGFAAFAGGAVRPGQAVWLQLAATALALAAAGAWAAGGRAPRRLPAPAVAGVALLAAFAVWNAVTLAWSVAPDRTWESANRAVVYAIVAGLALLAGATTTRAAERVALPWLAVSCAVALYALLGKVAPGLLDDTALTGRLRAPLEYWNALAAVCAFGVPVAVRLAADPTRAALLRLAGLAACWLLLLVVGLTYSRGGVLAVVLALAVTAATGSPRLRPVAAAAAAAVAAAPALAVAFGDPALRGEGVPLADRSAAGRELALWCALGLLALLAAGRLWLAREDRALARLPRARLLRALGATALVATALGLLALAATQRGVDGTARAAVERFTTPGGAGIGDPGRLADAQSGNRWLWWQEAAGAWADRPLGGWGAGSFPVTHRLFRTDGLEVSQPHSVPLQWLAETGAVGLGLAAGGLGLLLAAAIGRLRSLPAGRERGLAGALVAIAVVWTAHALVEWHWDIPAVTLPALLALGVVAARPRPAAAPPGPERAFADLEDRTVGGRATLLGVAALVAAAFAVSAVLPAWSDERAASAQTAASGTRDEASLVQAAADAELAARLDPLSVRPLFAAAAIAERRGRLADARGALLRAVRRQPWSAGAWSRLSETSLQLADRAGAARAARRWLELDPASPAALRAVQATLTLLAAPSESPTATGTPLPPPPAPPAPAAPPAQTPPAGGEPQPGQPPAPAPPAG